LPPNGGFTPSGSQAILIRVPAVASMSQATFTTTLTIGELEASFPLYCKALRILIREGKSLDQIQRSVCWHRLTSLHHCLPRQYKDPNHLYFHLKREICE
jgi:hypothetical protein